MTCAEVADRIIDRLYGELPESDRRAFELHLTSCEGCRRELDGLEQTRRTTRTALLGSLSQPAPARVHSEVLLAAEQAVRQRATQPTAPTNRPAIPAPVESAGFWAWLRRPWFLPAFGAVSLLALFFLARPALMDSSRRVLDESLSPPLPVANEPTASPLEDEPTVPIARPAVAPDVARGVVRGVAPEVASTPTKKERESAARRAAIRGAGGARTIKRALARKNSLRDGTVVQAETVRVVDREQAGRDETGSAAAPRSVSELFAAPPAEPTEYRLPNPQQEPRSRPADLTLRMADTQSKSRSGPTPPATLPARPRAFASGAVTAQPLVSPAAQVPPPAPASPANAPLERETAEADRAPVQTAASRARADQPLPLATLMEKADRLYAERKWQPALDAYRELLRRFPAHARAPDWRRRSAAATQSVTR